MARVQYGGGVTAFRGSIAGTTFQNNTSGPITRTRSAPRKATTPKQYAVIGKSFSLLRLWHGLASGQQTAWNDYAAANPRQDKFGTEKNISGYNAHATVNANRLLCGNDYTEEPPAATLPPSITTLVFAPVAGALTITATPEADLATTFMATYFSGPSLSAASLRRSALRLVSIDALPIEATFDFATLWQTTFGLPYPPSEGAQFYLSVFCYTINDTSGLVSTGVSRNEKYAFI